MQPMYGLVEQKTEIPWPQDSSNGVARPEFSATAPVLRPEEAAPTPTPNPDEQRAGLVRAAHADFQFIWRCLRRFGVQPDHCVDDAAQRVFEIAVGRVTDIQPGHERAFLFKTALWVAREFLRRRARRRELNDSDLIERAVESSGDPERLLEERRWRDRLDALLDALPIDLRTVFVLYELEGVQMSEIATLLEIPQGTVASRLRRARAMFLERARRACAESERFRVKP